MPDPTLIELAPGIHYLPGAVNVGVLGLPDGGSLLIDSGSDKDHAKRILKACRANSPESNRLEPRAILNTHSHADHYGGNAHLQETLQIPAYAPIFEEAIIRYPILEPIYLWGGARPPKALQNKFLMGGASGTKILNEPGPKEIMGLELDLLDVAGHAHQQFAVRCRDVLFAADAVFGPSILEKHALPFTVDVAHQREAIDALEIYARANQVRLVVPGHGDPTEDISGLCAANLTALERAENAVLTACTQAGTLPDILEKTCNALGLEMKNLGSYVLNQTAVLAFLTDLEEREMIVSSIAGNQLTWRAVH